jgi:hypothetical protein
MARSHYDDDAPAPPNETLGAALRKCEDGNFYNAAGAELQALISDLRTMAQRKQADVKGSYTLTIKLHMGRDGYVGLTPSVDVKKPKPTRLETTVYTDEDGDVSARPVEKQLQLREVSGGAAPERKAL